MKKLTAMLLCLAMVLVMLSGCNVKTKDDVKGPDTSSNDNSASTAADTNRDPIPITLLSLSSLETETNVVRDQLKKAGGNVVGVVMNYCNVEKSEYYYAYYNQQGKREKGSSSAVKVDSRNLGPNVPRGGGKHGGAANPANYGRQNNGARRG